MAIALQPRPAMSRAGVSAGLAGGGGGIQDLIAGLRQRVSPSGGGQMTALPMPTAGDPTMGAPGFQVRPLPAEVPGGGMSAMPFKPAPVGGMTAPGAPPPGAPTGGPLETQVVGPGEGGGPTSGAASPGGGAALARRPASIGGTDADFAALPDAGGPGPAAPKTPGWQAAGFNSRQQAANKLRKSGQGGTLKKFIQGKIAEGGPAALTKPAVLGAREGLEAGGVGGTTGAPASIPQGVRDAAAGAGPMATQVIDAAGGPGGPRSSSASAGPGGAPQVGRGQGFRAEAFAPEPAGGRGAALRPRPAGGMQAANGGGFRAEPFAPEPAPGGGMKPFVPPGLQSGPADLSPAEQWAQENMPGWARERGADSGAILNFIRKNPGSPLAQKFAASGMAM